MQNNAQSIATQHNISCTYSYALFISHHLVAGLDSVPNEEGIVAERRGSFTPSLERSQEADGAVIAGYAEPSAFRILRRENDQSSYEALAKAAKDDPNIVSSHSFKVNNAPSRRPTALGVPSVQ